MEKRNYIHRFSQVIQQEDTKYIRNRLNKELIGKKHIQIERSTLRFRERYSVLSDQD